MTDCSNEIKNKPLWLTKEYEEILRNEGFGAVICNKNGDWWACDKNALIVGICKEGWWVRDTSPDGRDELIFKGFAENPDWKESLIQLGNNLWKIKEGV